ncbi:cobalt transporter ATP-binding subunit [Companilactobacillus paralimentarius DSM 13238 = JCM 10415]|uniref:Energy-coupling factor transporter ATP-binding protein EcfA2 n=1 Tax=Companilactobacillus paralimentarius DSM 13238 = JCM 10415 TaxID=1122151 RepID=A0A0R1PAR1_9LACO|nr:energy-coupling factor ABC transporter ATP-binding protein [Companilactobacillus paralimentarius]KAE9561132.1 energy-coupling factor transporter ATPase [Companilactobacillus paralimentarius]KRL29542.1 cobalt transporter ATP-binding subunit [Companilactobacillus paralimentarius DSM 13238 = JCM 10415]MDR4933277.1 energy-coupling factor ABC transporter ATP-binding protein [Companilactobacillus paralimentarius]QFR69781.1 energy-coupling factor ABC transporter ATP-binding protein [Companilactobac
MEITFEHVTHSYDANSPMANLGLDDVSLKINDKKFTAIVGQTGSGKSTLVRHINALLKPTAGKIIVGDRVITSETNNKNLKPLRKKVGMVFQFPESQLFEETVEKDIMFGPMNFGFSESEAKDAAHKMIELVGLNQDYLQKSPFDLSGGQMRRVAIAGVLASNPETIILDEPTAGLDPVGRHEIMDLFKSLQTKGKTIILITHNMDDVANYADEMAVMSQGKLVASGLPSDVFNSQKLLEDDLLTLPQSAQFAQSLAKKYFQFDKLPITIDELSAEIKQQVNGD